MFVKMSERQDVYKVKPVTGRVKIKPRRKVPYEEMITLLLAGYDVFVENMDRRTAYYVKKKLSEYLGGYVEAFPAEYEGKHGYLFTCRFMELRKLLEEHLKSKERGG